MTNCIGNCRQGREECDHPELCTDVSDDLVFWFVLGAALVGFVLLVALLIGKWA